MFSFLWVGRPDKIKRVIIIQDYKNGGLIQTIQTQLYRILGVFGKFADWLCINKMFTFIS